MTIRSTSGAETAANKALRSVDALEVRVTAVEAAMAHTPLGGIARSKEWWLVRIDLEPDEPMGAGVVSDFPDRCVALSRLDVQELRAALANLTLKARTSGGTGGPDAQLMGACDRAEAILVATARRATKDQSEKS